MKPIFPQPQALPPGMAIRPFLRRTKDGLVLCTSSSAAPVAEGNLPAVQPSVDAMLDLDFDLPPHMRNR